MASYSLTEDKKCDCRSRRSLGRFKLLRSHKMIDAHIPHLHRKSGNRSCLAALPGSWMRKYFLGLPTHTGARAHARARAHIYIHFFSFPSSHLWRFFFSLFPLLPCHFKKLFIRLHLTRELKFTAHRHLRLRFRRNFLRHTLTNDFQRR